MRKRKLLISIIFCSMAIIIGFSLSYFVKEGQTSAHSSDSHLMAHSIFSNNVLQTINRDKFIVCVENVSSDKNSNLAADKLVNKVQKALDKYRSDSRWKNAGYGSITAEVKTGCSFKPVLNNDTAEHPIYSGKSDNFDRRVAVPSLESLGIFIVDQKVIDKNFKDAPNRWSPEQLACENNECNEVTKGIYLTSTEIQELNGNKLISEMVYGLGLESMIKPRADEAETTLAKEAQRAMYSR